MTHDPGPRISAADPRFTARDDLSPWLRQQLEDLIVQVWKCEAEWRFDDRIDLAVRRQRP